MRVLTLAIKDMKQLFQSFQTAFFLLIMPVIFTLMFGFMFGGFGGETEDPRLLIGVLDEDQTEHSQRFVDMLEASSVVRPITNADYTEETYRQEVENGDLQAALVLSAGFGNALDAGAAVPLVVIADEKAATVSQSIQSAVLTVYARLFGMIQTAELSQETAMQFTELTSVELDAYYEQALTLAASAWQTPPVTLETTNSGAEPDAGREKNSQIDSEA